MLIEHDNHSSLGSVAQGMQDFLSSDTPPNRYLGDDMRLLLETAPVVFFIRKKNPEFIRTSINQSKFNSRDKKLKFSLAKYNDFWTFLLVPPEPFPDGKCYFSCQNEAGVMAWITFDTM